MLKALADFFSIPAVILLTLRLIMKKTEQITETLKPGTIATCRVFFYRPAL